MYDYVKATASKNKITITFAYSNSENGVRKTEYLYEKPFNRFSRTTEFATSEIKTEIIVQQDFFYAYGLAVGELSNNVPTYEQ